MGGRRAASLWYLLSHSSWSLMTRAAKGGGPQRGGRRVLPPVTLAVGSTSVTFCGGRSHGGPCGMTSGSACSRPSCLDHRYSTHVHRVGWYCSRVL